MEIRKDYILDRWSIIAPHREKRPMNFKQAKPEINDKECPFCQGKEDQTPPEIGRIEENGQWKIRWFQNKFGFLKNEGTKDIDTHNKYYTHGKAFGEHEVIVETNDHNKQLHDFTVEEIKSVLKVYVARTKELSQKNKYVSVFKNHGINAGTSLVHSHTQVAAMNIDPPFVMQELKASFKGGKCLYCEIIQAEKNSDRRIFDNNTFISFCPYAPRFNFEAWIFPKHHIKSITELNDDQLKDLAEVLHKILPKIAKLNASYNFVIHNAPKQHDLHFHMEILPRIAKFGGLELATNVIVQQITPEQAAEFYRE